MATRAQVEAAVAGLDPRAGVIVSDGDGKLLAERPAAEGGGCVLVVVNLDLNKAIAEGRFSARPESLSFSLTRAQKRALARGRRQRAKEREAASRKQAAEFEAEYETATGGTRGPSRADSVPIAAPGKAGGQTPPSRGQTSGRLEAI